MSGEVDNNKGSNHLGNSVAGTTVDMDIGNGEGMVNVEGMGCNTAGSEVMVADGRECLHLAYVTLRLVFLKFLSLF